VDDPTDLVVVAVLGDNEPGVPGVHAPAQRRLGGLRHVHRHDRWDGGHHLPSLLLVKVEDPAQHPGLARIELPAGGAAGDDHLEVVRGGDLLEFRLRVHADGPQNPVRGAVERPDQRLEGHTEGLEEPRATARHALGVGDGIDLRHLLAERDVERGGDEVGERQRDGERHAVG
jgi:hypothetical protein